MLIQKSDTSPLMSCKCHTILAQVSWIWPTRTASPFSSSSVKRSSDTGSAFTTWPCCMQLQSNTRQRYKHMVFNWHITAFTMMPCCMQPQSNTRQRYKHMVFNWRINVLFVEPSEMTFGPIIGGKYVKSLLTTSFELKIDFFVFCWQHAHALFDATCFQYVN